MRIQDTRASRIIESLTQVKQILGLMNYRYTSSSNDENINLSDIGTEKFDEARDLLVREYDSLVEQLRQALKDS